MRRCIRCVMPDTVPGIYFNKDGLCGFCMLYKNEIYLGEEALQHCVDKVKAQKNRYDCIVPVSGGRDSTYVLYVAKNNLDLKVLAVNNDNEFQTNQALVNIKKACEILKIDAIYQRSKRNVAHKIVCNSLKAIQHNDLWRIRYALCDACGYGYRSAVYRAAEEYKVPLILWGESKAEATQKMEELAIIALAHKMRRQSKGEKKFSVIWWVRRYYQCMADYYKMLQRIEFPVRGNRAILSKSHNVWVKDKSIKEVRLFDYIPWERETIKRVISEKLGWEKPPLHVSTWRIDCLLHQLTNYYYYVLLGCTKDCFGYCNMINSGQMEREEALIQEEGLIKTCKDNLKELLESEMNLPVKDAKKILSLWREKKEGDSSFDWCC